MRLKIDFKLKQVAPWFMPGLGPWTCNSATLRAECRNWVDAKQVGGNSPSLAGWILWSAVIQPLERKLTKY